MFIHDELWVCQDCLLVIANGDDSGLDNHPETAEARRAAITAGLERLGPHVVADSDEETDIEFSPSPCGCCLDKLACSRHHCSVLCNHPECAP